MYDTPLEKYRQTLTRCGVPSHMISLDMLLSFEVLRDEPRFQGVTNAKIAAALHKAFQQKYATPTEERKTDSPRFRDIPLMTSPVGRPDLDPRNVPASYPSTWSGIDKIVDFQF